LTSRDRRLDHLEDCLDLLGHEAMTLSVLDGYVAGLIACPARTPFEVWTPFVFDPDAGAGADPGAASEDVAEALAAAARHYQSVADTLANRPGRYVPLFERDMDGAPLWELWIEGFATALSVQSAAFEALVDGRGEGAEALTVLCAYAAIAANEPPPMPKEEVEGFVAAALDLIPEALERLYAASWAGGAGARPAKVGRNDPCSCGSGRKFKKCCALP
jgi:uncharacterized protein